MHRYDEESGKISSSCYSAFVRMGLKAESNVVERADATLSKYLVTAGSLQDYPEIQAISPRVTVSSKKNTSEVSGK